MDIIYNKYMNISDNFIIQDYLKKDLPYHPIWGKEVVYYYSPQVTFREIPDEISLTIPTLCYNHCSKDCNSKFCWIENWKGKREELTKEVLKSLILKNEGISCVTIMTSLNFEELIKLFSFIKEDFPKLKTALYIGVEEKEVLNNEKFLNLIKKLDYLKVGSFKKEFGPLNSKTTNQKFYLINHFEDKDYFECINNKFIKM